MPLHTEFFGPASPDAPSVLAVHGLTGHGRRWAALAAEHLPEVRVVAPDLLGHGHSPWVPPWSFAHQVDALAEVVDEHLGSAPFVLVGHSFGGALAIRLANRLGTERISGLVLLDPAQGLDPTWALEVATDSLAHADYADADAARAAKRSEGWVDVPDRLLDKEIDDHLIDLSNGRVGWRVCVPAMAVAWSEMAEPPALPPRGLPTTVVIADRVEPPFVRPDFRKAVAEQRADSVEVIHADCGHMVGFDAPDLTARLIRSMLERS